MYLAHYGVKGMHWGIRRYQNYDGTLINKAYNRTGLDKKGNVVYTEKGYHDRQKLKNYRQANRAAKKAQKAYLKSTDKPTNKEELSVMGNAFDTKISDSNVKNAKKNPSVLKLLAAIPSVVVDDFFKNTNRKDRAMLLATTASAKYQDNRGLKSLASMNRNIRTQRINQIKNRNNL